MDAHALALQALNWLASQPAWLALAFIAFIAFIEYPIPPTPQDLIVVVGGVLAGNGAISPVALIIVVVIFSAAGAGVAAKIGSVAGGHPRLLRLMTRFVSPDALAKTGERFRKYGRLILVANRFLPGIRTGLIYGAGFFRVRIVDVAVCCGIGALLWNGVLIGLGLWVGKNLDEVIDLIEKYSIVAGSLVAGIIVVATIRLIVKRHKKGHATATAAAAATTTTAHSTGSV